MLISYVKIVDICKNRMSDKVFRKDLNYLFWNKHMIKLMYFIPELTMGDRNLILNLMKSSGPFLRIDKTHKIDPPSFSATSRLRFIMKKRTEKPLFAVFKN